MAKRKRKAEPSNSRKVPATETSDVAQGVDGKVRVLFAMLSLHCPTETQSILVRKLGKLLTYEDWKAHLVPKGAIKALKAKLPTIKTPGCVIKLNANKKYTLTRLLMELGITEYLANAFLSNAKITSEIETHIEDKDERWALEQGDSVHYKSCYANEPNADPYYITQRNFELIPFSANTLFFWTVGNLKSIDGIGFQARAKLRLIADRVSPLNKYLYIDRIYGHAALLIENIQQLKSWWEKKVMAEGWKDMGIYTMGFPRSFTDPVSQKRTFETIPPIPHMARFKPMTLDGNFYCHSIRYGYRDTIDSIQCDAPCPKIYTIFEVSQLDGLPFLLAHYVCTKWFHCAAFEGLMLGDSAEKVKVAHENPKNAALIKILQQA